MAAEPLSRVVRPPEINDLVKITLGGVEDPDDTRFASEVPSRVEDLTRDRRTGNPLEYRLAAPWFAGDLEDPPLGAECALQWVTPRGLCRLPCAFEAVEGTAGVRVWRVRVTGPVIRDERRRFVRVPWSVPVELEIRHDLDRLSSATRKRAEESGVRPLLAGLPDAVEGQAINFSEGGLRCLSPEPSLPEGLPLVVRFTLDDHHFEAAAFVVWSISQKDAPVVVPHAGKAPARKAPAGKAPAGKAPAGKAPAGSEPRLTVESALAFEDPRKHGEILRPLMFAAQLRARRAGLA